MLYTVTYTFIDSLNSKGKDSSFKTLEMRAAQSLATNSTNALKIRKSKIEGVVLAADFFRGSPTIKEGP